MVPINWRYKDGNNLVSFHLFIHRLPWGRVGAKHGSPKCPPLLGHPEVFQSQSLAGKVMYTMCLARPHENTNAELLSPLLKLQSHSFCHYLQLMGSDCGLERRWTGITRYLPSGSAPSSPQQSNTMLAILPTMHQSCWSHALYYSQWTTIIGWLFPRSLEWDAAPS